jgi:hypothetical protein
MIRQAVSSGIRLRAALGFLALYVGGISAVSAATALGSGGAKAPSCHARQLHMVGHLLGEADQMFTVTFTFTNASKRTCDLTGWPTVRLQARSGEPLPLKTERVIQGLSLASVHPVVVPPQGAASFDIYGADFNTVADRACPSQTSVILVTPPDNRPALQAFMRVPDCGRFLVAPIIKGRSDRASWSKIV